MIVEVFIAESDAPWTRWAIHSVTRWSIRPGWRPSQKQSASVIGNELSIRFGRQRLILTAMIGCIIVGSVIGFLSALSYYLTAGLVVLYGLLIWLYSSSLTARNGGQFSARASRRDTRRAFDVGYAGGFIGPLMIGWILDLADGQSVLGWGLAYAHVAVVVLIGPLAITFFRPRAIAGDRRRLHTLFQVKRVFRVA